MLFFISSRRRHTRCSRDWSSDVCSSDLVTAKSPGAGTPTGTVTFKDGSSILGTGTLNSSGKAMFTISTLAVGSHSITASNGGDANFNGSTSPTVTQTVK